MSPKGLLSDIGQCFADTARSVLPTVAEPSWFAPPVDMVDDADSLTIAFHVPPEVVALRADATGRSVVLRGRVPTRDGGLRSRHAMRVFTLPFDSPRGGLTMSRTGDLAMIHVRRRHPDARTLSPEQREASP